MWSKKTMLKKKQGMEMKITNKDLPLEGVNKLLVETIGAGQENFYGTCPKEGKARNPRRDRENRQFSIAMQRLNYIGSIDKWATDKITSGVLQMAE